MHERPDIPEQLIAAQAEAEYDLQVRELTFLPLGYDANSAVYLLRSRDGSEYFLKLRRGNFNPINVEVPHLLHNQGIQAIIPPIRTGKGNLFAEFEHYTIILFPYMPGKDGYEVKLTEPQWIELGRTLNRMHSAEIPAHLASLIPHDEYDPQWRERVKYFQSLVEVTQFDDSVARKLSEFMKSKREVIDQIVGRADELARQLSRRQQALVLCHSDMHPGNYHITDTGKLFLVDWDFLVYAPRERDLMCIGSGMAGDQPGGWQEQAFYRGYGQVEINWQALAYYRYERIVEDIAEFCKQLLLTSEGGEDRELAYQYLTDSFIAGHVVEVALDTDQKARQQTG